MQLTRQAVRRRSRVMRSQASDESNEYEILIIALSFKKFGIREAADHMLVINVTRQARRFRGTEKRVATESG